VIIGLGEWATRWLFTEPEPAVVDPIALTWWMHRRVASEAVPDERVVIEFQYTGDDPLVIWLVLDRGEPSVCTKHPGFDPDVVLRARPVELMRVFSGIETLDQARKHDRVVLEGPPKLVRRFGSWFLWSPFAPTVREVLSER
jgi:hypothetical protein